MPVLAERWQIMPWQMRRLTPNELGQILEIAKLEKREHDKAARAAKSNSRTRARR